MDIYTTEMKERGSILLSGSKIQFPLYIEIHKEGHEL